MIFLQKQTPPQILEKAKKATNFSALGEDILNKMRPAQQLDVSLSPIITNRLYGEIKGGFSAPMLKTPLSYNDDKSYIKNAHHMLSQNAEYAVACGNLSIVFDFGVEKSGYFKFKLYAKKGTTIDAEFFELADNNGIRHNPAECMQYICKDGWQEYTAFNPRGFRYVRFNISSAMPIKISYIGVENSTAMIINRTSFECDDLLINNAYKMCINSVTACMLETYVDCPGFEQVYWIGDAIVPSHVNLVNFGAYDYDLKCLDMIGESITKEYKNFYRKGFKNYEEDKYLVLPAFGTFVKGGLPEWSFMWLMSVYNYYLYSGDINGMKKLFPYVRQMLSNCDNMMDDRGLFAPEGVWNLIEWAKNDLLPCGEVTASNAWLSKGYAVFSQIAKELGEDELSADYQKKSEDIKAAINRYCWNDSVGAYCDSVRDEYAYNLYKKYFAEEEIPMVSFEVFQNYEVISEQTNTICLLCDCVPQNRMEKVEKIISRIEAPDYTHNSSKPFDNTLAANNNQPHDINEIVSVGSPYFLYYTFGALAKLNHHDGLLDVIRRDYGEMLSFGTNTRWEDFYNPKTGHWTRSVCHAWGAGAAVYLITDICGIKPLKPGFREFTFSPHLGNLRKVKASVPTPYGMIYVNIDVDKGVKDITHPNECRLV